VADASLEAALAAPPAAFDEPEELFTKVEDERIEELNEKLRDRVTTETEEKDESDTDADTETENMEDLADGRISFEQFQDIDMRVGEITAAEPIDGADELVRLDVDIGIEQRQVVAGLKQLHDVGELPGTRVILLANMEKAELFGYESNGMVLAAGDEADLLTTHEDASLGERVR